MDFNTSESILVSLCLTIHANNIRYVVNKSHQVMSDNWFPARRFFQLNTI